MQGLYFEDEIGYEHPVTGEALASLFKQFSKQIECVLLNACYSEVQANAIVQHINYVIGMNDSINDKAAIEFAVGFYDAIAAYNPEYDTEYIVKLLWIYNHEQFAKRPADKDLKSVIKEILEL